MLLNSGVDTVETTTIEYATITYQRDRKMPNYAQIVSSENEYNFLRTELAEKVNDINQKDQVTLKDILRPQNFMPTLNPKKHMQATKMQARFIMSKLGIDSPSKDAVQKRNELISQYEQSLAQIRRQAETLL